MMVGRDVRLRKAAFGVALVTAAPLYLTAWLLVSNMMTDAEEFVAELTPMSAGRVSASIVTGALFYPFAVIAVLGLMHLLRERTSLIRTIGGGLTLAGLALGAAAAGAFGALAEAARAGIDPVASAQVVDATLGGVTMILMIAGTLLPAIGTTLLGFALYAARSVPRASAVLLAAYGPLQLVGFGANMRVVIILSFVALALALIPAGVQTLRTPADEWETPPVLRGPAQTGSRVEAKVR